MLICYAKEKSKRNEKSGLLSLKRKLNVYEIKKVAPVFFKLVPGFFKEFLKIN